MIHYLNDISQDILLQNNGYWAMVTREDMERLIDLGKQTINPSTLPTGWVELDIPFEDLLLDPEIEDWFEATGGLPA